MGTSGAAALNFGDLLMTQDSHRAKFKADCCRGERGLRETRCCASKLILIETVPGSRIRCGVVDDAAGMIVVWRRQ